MAHSTTWTFTDLPKEIASIIKEDVKNFDKQFKDSEVIQYSYKDVYQTSLDNKVRRSKNCWIPSTHWVAGFLWYYIKKSNDSNFRYDLYDIDAGTMQYTEYKVGDMYTWHTDGSLTSSYIPETIPKDNSNIGLDLQILNGECTRKLSFSLLLSDPDEYTGGEFQIMDEHGILNNLPQSLGSLIVFDSRSKHRVRPVKSGVRRSLVGWVVGPRWR